MVKSTERLSLFGGRDTPATPSSDASGMLTPTDNGDEIIEIAAHGDLVIKIEQFTTWRKKYQFNSRLQDWGRARILQKYRASVSLRLWGGRLLLA